MKAFILFAATAVSVDASCGVLERTGNGPATLTYEDKNLNEAENCIWTLTPTYDHPIPSVLPDKKTMLIMTINEFGSGVGGTGQLSVVGGDAFTQEDSGKCYRYIQPVNNKCNDTDYKNLCQTELKTIGNIAVLKYQIMLLGIGSRLSVTYQFVKCGESSVTPATTIAIKTTTPAPMTTTPPSPTTTKPPASTPKSTTPTKAPQESTTSGSISSLQQHVLVTIILSVTAFLVIF